MFGVRRGVVALLSALTALAGLGLGGQPAAAISLVPGENVTTTGGIVQGSVGADRRSFKGIPFAAPPVGKLRFAAPAAPASWTGERSARDGKPACAQAFPVIGSLYPSSEDCLYLDVYTPPAARSKNLPVLVWFYGGSYLVGSNGQYDPTPLVTQGNAIVVQVNYRLGPFGFLDVPGSGANVGLQDQQAGLRWVRDNIAAFGGDPSTITIFGESAGGNSVCQQLVSPAAAGLFSRAIVMSGACGAPFIDAQPPADAQGKSLAYARTLGCTGDDVLACLRGKSKNELLSTPTTTLDAMATYWHPVADGAVIPMASGAAFASGAFTKVPVMLGSLHDEGRLFVAVFDHLLRLGTVSPARYEAEVRDLFGSRAGAILQAYPAAKYGSRDKALAAVWTDALFSCRTTAALTDLAGKVPTYGYEFDDPDPPLAGIDPFMALGSYHGSDLWFLFSQVFGAPRLPLGAAQQKLSAQMIGYWTAFARTGDPNGTSADGSTRPAWPRAGTGDLLKLRSTGPFAAPIATMGADHNCGFWNP